MNAESELQVPAGVPDSLRALPLEAKQMIRDQLREMAYRNQILAHTVAFSGVLTATVFIAIYDWQGTAQEWDELQNYALDHGFCIERASH